MTATCDRPPAGWECRLPTGHDGPCPTWPKDPSPTRRAVARLSFDAAVLWLLLLPTWTGPRVPIHSAHGAVAVLGSLAAVAVLACHTPPRSERIIDQARQDLAANAHVEAGMSRLDGAREGIRSERMRIRGDLAPLLASDLPESAREQIVAALYPETDQ